MHFEDDIVRIYLDCDRYHPDTCQPQLSEAAILNHVKFLSEDIGFRTVGTLEHMLGDEYMFRLAHLLKDKCEEAVRNETGRHLECEVWRQSGNGSHRCVVMGSRLSIAIIRPLLDLTSCRHGCTSHTLTLRISSCAYRTARLVGRNTPSLSIPILIQLLQALALATMLSQLASWWKLFET